MKFPVLALIKLVIENKHHSLCVAKNSKATSLRTPRRSNFSLVTVIFSPVYLHSHHASLLICSSVFHLLWMFSST